MVGKMTGWFTPSVGVLSTFPSGFLTIHILNMIFRLNMGKLYFLNTGTAVLSEILGRFLEKSLYFSLVMFAITLALFKLTIWFFSISSKYLSWFL